MARQASRPQASDFQPFALFLLGFLTLIAAGALAFGVLMLPFLTDPQASLSALDVATLVLLLAGPAAGALASWILYGLRRRKAAMIVAGGSLGAVLAVSAY